ncbi:MAG: hypothetical protein IAG13_22190 [Deltaproteobacteria bacterium]|nr:hypothetical protein [Nannocystaceae bacterium]
MNRTAILPLLVVVSLGCCESSPGAGDSGETTGGSSSSSPGTTPSDSSASMPASTEGSVGSSGGADESSSAASVGSSDDGSSESTGSSSEPGPDLRMPGPHAVDTSSDDFSTGGCTMVYDLFAPADLADAPTVVLAHGFQGNRGSMADWAEHYASWGLRVVTPNLCHASILDADHAQNGLDLIALADHLGWSAPIYAGYSAGGLAALLAAAQDPEALALVALDAVDSGGLGAAPAAGVTVPSHDITAEPAMCNGTANGVPVFSAIGGSNVVRVREADHCDFQSPPDGLCSICSEPNSRHTTESIQSAIRGLSTAALLWHSGLDDTGAQWWTPGGPYYDAMIEDGTLVQL